MKRNLCLEEEWFVRDYIDRIDRYYPHWRTFGDTPDEALHEIYGQSSAMRCGRVLAGSFDHASGTEIDAAYRMFFGPPPQYPVREAIEALILKIKQRRNRARRAVGMFWFCAKRYYHEGTTS